MTTLSKCLTEAAAYWGSPQDIQAVRARVCVEILGGSKAARGLTVVDATRLLKALNNRGLARKTVSDYYSSFKRMLALNDQIPSSGYARWPRPPAPPRHVRKPITADTLTKVAARLHERGFGCTADLARLLDAIGGRVQREVLWSGNLKYRTSDGTLLVFITGKGGHEREIPIVSDVAKQIIRDRTRYGAILAVPYKTHLWRWNTICEELGIKGLATFHNIRHKYATEALGRSGGNLRVVQELLGHSNPATTAIYAHVSRGDMVKALSE